MIPGNINTDLISGADEAAYQISRSLRFNSSDSAYCDRSFTSAGNRKTWTFAAWVKLSALTGTNSSGGGTLFHCRNGTGDDGITDFLINTDGTVVFTGGASTWLTTTQVLRDFSAWYHLVMSVDTTAATASNRLRLYINGSQVTTFNVNVSPTQNSDLAISQAATHRIGGRPSFSQFFNGYLADVHFIDGQALTPSSFTEVSATTGQLIPKAYTGSFGTNGFWLKFSDNSAATATTLGKDYSGNNNNWSPSNLSVTAGAGNDSLVDTPTSGSQVDTGLGGQVTGNYCTLNPLTSSGGTYSQGNLRYVGPTSYRRSNGTIAVSTGKWYWEVTLGNNPYSPRASTSQWNAFGFGVSSVSQSTTAIGNVTDAVILQDSGYYKNFSGSQTDGGVAFASGDVLSCAVDLDANTFTFRRNNTQIATGTIGGTPGRELVPIIISYDDQYGVMDCNFGARPFAYQAPAGYKCLCDTSLPLPVVAKPSTVMDVKLYTGNGSTQTISGLGFSPDFAWFKVRNNTSHHTLYDIVRGATKSLCSSNTNAEATEGGGLSAFTSDGFSLSGDNTIQGSTNANGGTYVAWCFDAGTTTTTNTAGSITGGAQVRANPSAGFSIITFTMGSGSYTVGHGLNTAPSLLITKARSNTSSWWTYHASLGTGSYLALNSTAAAASDYSWGSAPTSTVFTANNNFFTNGYTYVVYAFSPVAGYSSFGSYTGNGSTDGPFVYLGFRPRWILFKNSSVSVENWWLHDTARNTYNVMTSLLLPDSAGAEATNTAHRVDALSNGFKIRTNAQGVNGVHTIVYAAFAENPFQYARAR